MRTTVDLDESLLNEASRYSGIKQKTQLLEEGLRRIIQQEAARRLALLGGSDPQAVAAPRKRYSTKTK